MHADEDRERLRQTFDRAAQRYDRVRPEYPEALFDDLVALAGLTRGDQAAAGAAPGSRGAAGLGCGAARRTAPGLSWAS